MKAISLNRWARRGLFAAIWLALVFGLAFGAGLRINPTPSLPKGLYRLASGAPAKGDLVSFCLEGEYAALAKERGYLHTGSCPSSLRPLLKRLAGLPGDTVNPDTLNIRTLDSQGRPMPSALRGGIIPPGMALVLADHEGSFDSRYYGLVQLDALQRVEAVWIWN